MERRNCAGRNARPRPTLGDNVGAEMGLPPNVRPTLAGRHMPGGDRAEPRRWHSRHDSRMIPLSGDLPSAELGSR